MGAAELEMSRDSIDAFNRGDLDAALEHAHPEVQWHVYLSPEGEVARGRDAVKRMWLDRREIFGDFQWDVAQMFEADGWVIAVGELRGLAPGAGSLEVAASLAQMYRITDGQLHEVRAYRTKEEALS